MQSDLWWFLAILIIVLMAAQKRSPSKPRHCMTCGTEAIPANNSKGSIGLEIILWILFIIPGVIYGVWRRSSDNPSCAACGSKTLVPIESPAAVGHRKSLQP